MGEIGKGGWIESGCWSLAGMFLIIYGASMFAARGWQYSDGLMPR